MKVFVVGSESGDSFGHNVAVSFRAKGHEVCSENVIPRGGRFRALSKEILMRSSGAVRQRAERQVRQIVSRFRPKLTVICTRTLEPDTVRFIRKESGGAVICWYGDSPANLRWNHIVDGEYDAVFAKDKRFAHDLANIVGLNAFHLNEACNPTWHRPMASTVQDHVLVAGTMYGYRTAVLNRLLQSGVAVKSFGPRPPAWLSPTLVGTHQRISLDQENKAIEFGRALVCLNTFAPAEREALNCRIFETCASGGLLVSEFKTAIDECFTPQEEYLPFKDFEELLANISRARQDVSISLKMRRLASLRAHSEHTYGHRIDFILSKLAS